MAMQILETAPMSLSVTLCHLVNRYVDPNTQVSPESQRLMIAVQCQTRDRPISRQNSSKVGKL